MIRADGLASGMPVMLDPLFRPPMVVGRFADSSVTTEAQTTTDQATPFHAWGMFGRFAALLDPPETTPTCAPAKVENTLPPPFASLGNDTPLPRDAPSATTLDRLILRHVATEARSVRAAPPAMEVARGEAAPCPPPLPPSPCAEAAEDASHPGRTQPSAAPRREPPLPRAHLWIESDAQRGLAIRIATGGLSEQDMRRLKHAVRVLASDHGLTLDKLGINGQDHTESMGIRRGEDLWRWHR